MHHEEMCGLFSISLAIVNLLLSFVLFKNKKVDNNILYLLIGITLTFISLTAPIQLNGHYITMFWAAETVLLYWLYLKSNIQLMKLASLIIWGAMIVSLLMDWGHLYSSSVLILNIIANKGFITTLMTALSSYLLYLQIMKDESKNIYELGIPADIYRYSSYILLFMSGLLEINHQFLNRYPDTNLNVLYLLLYVPVFIYVFSFISKRIGRTVLSWIANAVIIMICISVYLFSLTTLFDLEYVSLVQHKLSANHFYAHFAGAIFMAALLYKLVLILRDNLDDDVKRIATWILSVVIVTFLSMEVCLALNLLVYSPATSIERIETVYIQVGLPILWGLCSFVLMILGMRHKVQTLRIVSLTLFSITLIKLFVFDLQGIPPAGKISAFFFLGVLLLIVSFMYQKVKKILVDGDKNRADV